MRKRHQAVERIFHGGNFLRGLHEKFSQRRHERDGAIEIGIASFLISPDANQFFGSLVVGEQAADLHWFLQDARAVITAGMMRLMLSRIEMGG